MTKVTFIRHAKPLGLEHLDDVDYNTLNNYILHGKAVGLSQKQSLKESIFNPNSVVYCSEYLRSQETAKMYGFTDLIIHPGANEIDMNLRELMTREEYHQSGFHGFRNIMYRKFFEKSNGVESSLLVQGRYQALLSDISNHDSQKECLVFCHGFMMNMIRASHILKKSITEITFEDYYDKVKDYRFNYLEVFSIFTS